MKLFSGPGEPPPLQRSLAITVAAAAVLPLLLVSSMVINHLLRDTAEDISEKNQLLAQAMSEEVEEFLREPLTVLLGIRGMLLAEPEIPDDRIRHLLDTHARISNLFESILLIDGTGNVRDVGLPLAREGYRDELIGISLAHMSFLQSARTTGNPQWSDTFLSVVTGKMSLALCVPLNGQALVGNFNIDRLSSFVGQIHIGRRMVATVLDRRGAIIVHPDPSIAAKQLNISHLPLVRAALGGEALTATYPFEGQKNIGSVAPIPGPGWVALVSQTTSHAYRHVRHTATIFAGAVLGTIALALILAGARARKMARPFSEFAARAGVVAQGTYDLTFSKPSHREVRELASSFSRMVDAIREREGMLVESRRSYQELIEGTDDLVTRWNAEGRLVFVNHAAEHVYGLSPEDCVGLSALDFVHPEDRDETRTTIEGWFAARQTATSYETRQINVKTGHVHHMLWTINIHYDDEGRVSDLNGIARDITERIAAEENLRNLEEQLFHSQKMESIGRLAGGVAHDFNNMLSSILGYSELALMHLPKNAEPVSEYLKAVQEAGEKAAGVARQLLAFSRKQRLELKVVDPNAMVQGIGKLLDKTLGEDVELRIASDLPISNIETDPGQFEQILMNLAINARDAMPEGGTLLIETRNVRLEENFTQRIPELKPGDYVCVSVTDNGSGMAAETRNKIFEPFFTTKEPGKGTGLGLATVHGIVKQHRGHLEVESALGQGTTFRLYFPASSQDVVETGPGDTGYLPRGAGTVLVVDDEGAIRNLVADTLTPLGYHVLGSTSGEDALRLIDELSRPVDLLLTDVIMPGMGGYDLAEEFLRRHAKGTAILMSGYADWERTEKILKRGNFPFLQKPLTPGSLARLVAKVLGQRPSPPEESI